MRAREHTISVYVANKKQILVPRARIELPILAFSGALSVSYIGTGESEEEALSSLRKAVYFSKHVIRLYGVSQNHPAEAFLKIWNRRLLSNV